VSSVRLDRRIREAHSDLSWRQIRETIEKGQVTIDGKAQRDPGFLVSPSARLTIDRNRPAQIRVRASFNLLHEDDHIIVLNKPAGLLSIPTSPDRRDSEDTVLRRVREYVTHKLGRPGYVGMLHRLDRETSGALAVALSKEAHAAGRDLFKHHRFERRYLALVQGVLEQARGTIEARISSGYRDGRRKLVGREKPGLDATTHYLVREQFAGAALLELRLHTGRQHQIRLHLEKLGHPLLGESVYTEAQGPVGNLNLSRAKSREGLPPQSNPRAAPSRNMLHAWTLAFPHPITGARVSVEAPLPDDFERMLGRLRRAR
jgi:23S rRNA pseudouridine1911/1915/1917 synthase